MGPRSNGSVELRTLRWPREQLRHSLEDNRMSKKERKDAVGTVVAEPAAAGNGEGKRPKKKVRKDGPGAAIAAGNGHVAGNGSASEAKADTKGHKLSRKRYEDEIVRLQTELCKLQDW